MARNETVILNAKRHLYATLLEIPIDELTEQEVRIGFEIVKDPQFQEFLDIQLAKERTTT